MVSTPARTSALFAGLLAAGLSLAACNTDSSGKPSVRAAPPAPLTHHQAALDCWMATEHGHADLPLDQRADLVDACIKAKMAGKPWPAAAQVTPNVKPNAKRNVKPKGKPKAQHASPPNAAPAGAPKSKT